MTKEQEDQLLDDIARTPAFGYPTKRRAKAVSSSSAAPGSARAVELLTAQRDRHAENVRRLSGQLKGVERALEVEQGKLAAIEEALTALAPNDQAERP